MLRDIVKRKEEPVPSRKIRIIYIAFIVIVLLFYSVTMILNERKPGVVAEFIKKVRIIASGMISSPK